jgi:hypothetical protein
LVLPIHSIFLLIFDITYPFYDYNAKNCINIIFFIIASPQYQRARRAKQEAEQPQE